MAERTEATEYAGVHDAAPPYPRAPVQMAPDDVPPGYKRTEVGVIPEGWEVKTLRDLSSMKSGESITSARIAESSLYPCFGGNGLRGFTDRCTHDGDYVLIGRQGALCGNILRVSGQFYASEHAVVTTAKYGVDIDWLSYVLDTMELNRLSESSAQPGLSVQKVLDIQTAIPTSRSEQRAIATALLDADALIESLDRLIAKKRAIKQAAMQQLLTGETRLPGFQGLWSRRPLGQLLTIRYGRNQSKIEEYDGRYPILATGGEIGRTDTPLYEGPSVLIGRKGTIDEPQFMDSPFWTVDTLFYTEIHRNAHPKFVFYVFMRIPWREYNEASGVPSLNGKTIEKIEVVVPDIEEQTAIANVLSDMDAEIEGLESRREKARQIKQGMMQELLTGRTRLVEPNPGPEASRETTA